MPKLYEYFGLVVLFFTNEHLPIHVHVLAGDRSCKVLLYVEDGKLKEIKIVRIGKNPFLKSSEVKKSNELLKYYSQDIVDKWIQYFTLNKKFKPIRITRRLK
ncbi:MAG TPA: DUF4160 domain-containing protein [Bacteroidia bacterium]|nr:DUF4160 domain-containing protein [Bacteroidia bacterium]